MIKIITDIIRLIIQNFIIQKSSIILTKKCCKTKKTLLNRTRGNWKRKLFAAQILRNKQQMFQRLCRIQPELALDDIGKYWEQLFFVFLFIGIHNNNN